MAYELEDEMEALPEFEDELEDEGELEAEDELEDEGEGEGWLSTIGNIAGSLLGEGEDEYEDEGEGEFEDELEDEVSPVRKIYSDAMMEHLGELASEAESEDEAAEHFLPLIGMAASKLLPVVARAVAPAARRMLPKIARAVTKASPHLTKSIGRVARVLHRNPQTRRLLKVVPTIARRTVGTIARQAAHGRHITPRLAVRTLARTAKRVLGHPHHRRHALRHHHHLERRFHHHHGRGIAHPRYGVRHGRGYGYRPGVRTVGGVHYRHGVAGPHVRRGGGVGPIAHGGGVYRPGRIVGGRHVCPPCPSCGGTGSNPKFCRCCGQPLR
jgi:hypothetical protein